MNANEIYVEVKDETQAWSCIELRTLYPEKYENSITQNMNP